MWFLLDHAEHVRSPSQKNSNWKIQKDLLLPLQPLKEYSNKKFQASLEFL